MLNDATPPVSHALHRAAVFTIWPEVPATADPARHRIWAYCDALSYAPGDPVRVHVQCSAASFDLEITRDSASPQIVLAKEGLRGGESDTPEDCSVKGCGWPVAFEFRVPEDWRSAAYRLTTRVAGGGNRRASEHHHLFIVRPPLPASQVVARPRLLLVAATASWTAYNDWGGSNHYEGITGPGRNLFSPVLSIHRPLAHLFIVRPPLPASQVVARPRLLLVAATASWTAYNDWGGSNHYEGITGPQRNLFSPVLSIHRPLAKGFVVLPANAPRIALTEPPAPMAPPRYPHMEWAYRNGYSKKYASSGWASYDRHFAHWAERQGYDIDVCSQTDLHLRPEILRAYACVAFIGHCEYWSWEMRDAVDDYVANGGRVARFAGNFGWQIRLEDEGATQVCYKYRAPGEDPYYGTDKQRFVTNLWDSPDVGRPGASTFGLNGTRGLYVGWGGMAPRGAGGFPIYRPDHWAFKNTGLSYGDVLGAQSKVFGYEVDGLDYEMRGGLPYPTKDAGAPDGLEILALGQATLSEEGEHVDPDDVFIAHLDSAFLAQTLLGDDSMAAIDRIKRTCGMMVNFPKGKGEVFHAGSCEWVAGLIRRDALVEQVTRNVIGRYLER